MRSKRISWIFILVWSLLMAPASVYSAQNPGFTQEDRERLIRLETTLQLFMDQTNKRFEDLRADMNARFEQVDKRFEQVDKRFEQVDKRFEQVGERFEDLISFLWMLAGIFTAMTVATIGFAYWDRRTMIRKAREETIEFIEKEGRLKALIQALRQLAAEDAKLAEVLRSYGLL